MAAEAAPEGEAVPGGCRGTPWGSKLAISVQLPGLKHMGPGQFPGRASGPDRLPLGKK